MFGLDCIRKGTQLSLLPIFSQTTCPDLLEPFLVDCLELASENSQDLPDSVMVTCSLDFKTKRRLNEILFESLEFERVSICNEPSANILYSEGLTTGLVVECGHQHTTVTPIVEGY